MRKPLNRDDRTILRGLLRMPILHLTRAIKEADGPADLARVPALTKRKEQLEKTLAKLQEK